MVNVRKVITFLEELEKRNPDAEVFVNSEHGQMSKDFVPWMPDMTYDFVYLQSFEEKKRKPTMVERALDL